MESFLKKDFYAILGVRRDAREKEIKQRFLQLAREKHPDRFRGEEKAQAEQEFQDITEAFNVLTDPVRRRQVDLHLQQPKKAGEHDPSDVVRVYMNRGIRAFKQSNLIEAASNFSRAADTDPKNAQAWHHLALACSKEKRWTQKAQEAIVKACELRPDHPPYLQAGRPDLRDAGMASRAKQYYNQAIKLGSTDASSGERLQELSGGDASDGKKPPAKEKSGLFGKLFVMMAQSRPMGPRMSGCYAPTTRTTYDINDRDQVYVVADGMGGHNHGEVASQIAVETILNFIEGDQRTVASGRSTRATGSGPDRHAPWATTPTCAALEPAQAVDPAGPRRGAERHPPGRLAARHGHDGGRAPCTTARCWPSPTSATAAAIGCATAIWSC